MRPSGRMGMVGERKGTVLALRDRDVGDGRLDGRIQDSSAPMVMVISAIKTRGENPSQVRGGVTSVNIGGFQRGERMIRLLLDGVLCVEFVG